MMYGGIKEGDVIIVFLTWNLGRTDLAQKNSWLKKVLTARTRFPMPVSSTAQILKEVW